MKSDEGQPASGAVPSRADALQIKSEFGWKIQEVVASVPASVSCTWVVEG
jgi:hypothetical protein